MLMISGREFVMLSGIIVRDGITYIIAKYLPEYEKSVPVAKGIVRGELKIGGWILEKKSENSCKGTYMINLDTKGNIPQFAQEKTASL